MADADPWYENVDPKSGKSFYYRKKSKERTWKKPAKFRPLARADGAGSWREHKDKNGRTFYANKTTGEKSWVAPKGWKATPKGTPKAEGKDASDASAWVSKVDEKTGRTYYVNRASRKRQWKRPAGVENIPAAGQGAAVRKDKTSAAAATAAASARKARDENGGGEDDEVDDDEEKKTERRRRPAAAARPRETLDDYDSYSDDDDDDNDGEGGEEALRRALDEDAKEQAEEEDADLDRPRMKTVVTSQRADGTEVREFNITVDVVAEAFKLLPKTEDEALILRRLEVLDVESPGTDERVAAIVRRKRGLFSALVRLLKRFAQNEAVVASAMHVLKKVGSVEEFVIPAVESDIVGRVIATLTLHMNNTRVVGDSLILLGNLALNDYVKELVRMEEGVKVISLVMVNEVHQDDAAVLDKCCYCLANLAVDNTENVREIIGGGALASVISCMGRFRGNSDLLDSGSVVLSNICAGGDEQRRAIAEAGAVGTLVSILNDQCAASEACDGADAAPRQVVEDCLQALGNLALQAETIRFMLRDGAVEALARTIRVFGTRPAFVTLAVSVLGNLAAECDGEQVATIAARGGVSAIVDASRGLPDNAQAQMAFFGSLANFSKATVNAGSQVDEDVMGAVGHVREVLNHMPDHENVVFRGVRLVVRVAEQEHRTRRLASEGFPAYLSSLLRRRQANASAKLVREVLLCTAAIANESTAREIGNGTIVDTVAGVVVDFEDDEKVVEAAIKALRNLSAHPDVAVKVAGLAVRPLVAAAEHHRNKPPFVERLSPLLGDLAIYEGTMEHILAANAGLLLVELLEEYSRSPGIAAKIVVALHNMTLSDENFGKQLKASRVDRTVNEIVDENGGHVPLRSAAAVFLARLRELPDIDADDHRAFDELKEDEKNRVLREKFNIPELPRATLNFLTAGGQLRLHRRSGNPRVRQVTVADHVRFLELRDLSSEKPEVRFPLRRVTEVLRGVGSAKALRRSYFMQRDADPEHSFVVTVEEDEPFCFEASSPEMRDQWVDALHAAFVYRTTLQRMRSELTAEEKESYG